jgi:sugar lactone lactonase YvrE
MSPIGRKVTKSGLMAVFAVLVVFVVMRVVSRRVPPRPVFPLAADALGLGEPSSIAVDSAGNLYIAAPALRRVLRLSSDGQLTEAAVGGAPVALAIDSSHNVYFADASSSQVRRLDPSTGSVMTVAGGGGAVEDGVPAAKALLREPAGLAIDTAGNLYVADRADHRVRRVLRKTGVIETVAGDGFPGSGGDQGPAAQARLSAPTGLAFDAGGHLHVTDRGNHRIRRIDGQTGIITTIAGSGRRGSAGDGHSATEAEWNAPAGIAFDTAGNLLVADAGNFRVRRIDKSGVVSPVPRTFTYPVDVAVNAAGIVFVADAGQRRVLRLEGDRLATAAGNGGVGFRGDGRPAREAAVAPKVLALSTDGRALYFTEVDRPRVRRLDLDTGIVTTVAGNGVVGDDGDNGPAVDASLTQPAGLAVDGQGNVYVADAQAHRIRRIAPDGAITAFAGTGEAGFDGDGGPAMTARLAQPRRLLLDGKGHLYIADIGNMAVRRVHLETQVITTAIGTQDRECGAPPRDGLAAAETKLELLSDIALDSEGQLWVARMRAPLARFDPQTATMNVVPVKTCGAGGQPIVSGPDGHMTTGADGQIWISDSNPTRIWAIGGKERCATLAFGSGTARPSQERHANIHALATDASGKLYLATMSAIETLHRGRLVLVAGGGAGL